MRVKNITSISILVVLVGLFIIYIKNNISNFQALSFVSPYLILILILLVLTRQALNSIITKNLLYPLGISLRKGEAFALSIVTGFYNLITPFRGGAVTRAIYLKKKHAFSYTNFLASLAGMYVITFLIASSVGIISTLTIYFSSGVFSRIIFAILCAVFFPLLVIVVLSPKLPLTKTNFANRFIKVINGWHLIKNNKRIIIITTLVSLIQLILGAVMFYLQFRVFGLEVGFVGCLFLASIGSLSMLIAITPAGLGINEAIIVFSALTIGITPAESLGVVLLGRAVQMSVLCILGPIFSYILLKHQPSNRNETHN